MEDQAEYKVKERPFHGEYSSPGQGKRPDQYESSAILLGYVLGFTVVLIVVFGGYKMVEFIIDFVKNW